MLFSKKIDKHCGNCLYAVLLEDDRVECRKKGMKHVQDKCMRYTYDPCKRVPSKSKATDFSKYEEYDYSL